MESDEEILELEQDKQESVEVMEWRGGLVECHRHAYR
jgi:hypothetical protein